MPQLPFEFDSADQSQNLKNITRCLPSRLYYVMMKAEIAFSRIGMRLFRKAAIKSRAMVISSENTIRGEIAGIWEVLFDINSFSRWHPLISHSVLYGKFESGSAFKFLVGQWDFDCEIADCRPPEAIFVKARTIGLLLDINIGLSIKGPEISAAMLISCGGWLTRLFRRKLTDNIRQHAELFLSSLKMRIERGEAAIKKNDISDDDTKSEPGSISMPTPFTTLYRSRPMRPGKNPPISGKRLFAGQKRIDHRL